MASKEDQIYHLRSLLSVKEIFSLDADPAEYKSQSATWSTWADKHPGLVLQPTSLGSLSAVTKALYNGTLDFAVRNTGTGSVSAEDVILSTHGFKSFSFSQEKEEVTIGAGLDWGEVDRLMEERAPGWQVVGARCSWVGVAGSSLVGGLSWLSHEFGMISDPQNLLDMQVCLRDGRVVWASEEEEGALMWALRGGGGGFGVVTALKLRARRYPEKVFCGLFFYPYSSIGAISKAIHQMHLREPQPKLAMHILTRGSGMGEPPGGQHPNIAIIAYDAEGEEHARSEAGFGWAWTIDGVQEMQAGMMTVRQVNAVAETFRDWQGNNVFWLCAPLLEEVDEHTLERAWQWWEEAYKVYPGFQEGSTVLFEFMQKPALSSTSSPAATAWPRKGHRHVMQLCLGCKPDDAPSDIKEKVMALFRRAGPFIAGGEDKDTGEFHAGFLHEWNDLEQVYGGNLGRLRETKAKYDPKNRFNKGLDLREGKVEAGTNV